MVALEDACRGGLLSKLTIEGRGELIFSRLSCILRTADDIDGSQEGKADTTEESILGELGEKLVS